MRADVHRFGLKDPSDVLDLCEAIDKGVVDPAKIVAVIGKTHGNGLVNDYTRGYLTLCLSQLIVLGLSIEKADDVHFVQVKGPAFTLDDIVAANHAGLTCRTDNPGKLMAFGRGASALGVGKALRKSQRKRVA
jgi:hypothetical protein